MSEIFAYILHKAGKADDTAMELVTAAKKIDAGAEVTALVLGSAADADAVAGQAANHYKKVWKVADAALAYPNAELIRPVLQKILPAGAIVLLPTDSFGMDLGPGLAVKMGAAYLADVVNLEAAAGGKMKADRQEYSGQVYAKVEADVSGGAVITTRPGAFPANEAGGAGGAVVDKTADAGAMPTVKRKFLEVVAAEVGDVDITKSDVLVSIGRGIESEDNLEMAFDLAKAMGADVSCSRPIVDAKWMEKSRQVGTSGQTVKPKVYMAMGISGAFQHLGGLKGNPFILAVNKNAKAPIFQVAE
ncbi:MAG: electron transfer flavoprotein subunit alpha/FixB family protein, partial [Pseudomonadota bacterium]